LSGLSCRYEINFPRYPITILWVRTPGGPEDRFIAGPGTIVEGTMGFVRGSAFCPATLTVSGAFGAMSPTQTITML
ncbi:MAG TPA: hypothetical protein VK506_07255, partial [Conexibacter sp.]|nr:hypothetical protein [Conexibacter sp.]